MLERIRAIGDGNCAYNAFILGLLDISQQGLLDNNKTSKDNILDLLKKTKTFQNILTWEKFKEWINQIKSEEELVTLQEESAEILRGIAADQIKENMTFYAKSLIEEAVEAFRCEVELACGVATLKSAETSDRDFFIKHNSVNRLFINTKKSYDFKANPNEIDKAVVDVRKELTNLFQESNCKEFCDELRDNNTRIWGNHFVLSVLANYFGIDLLVTNGSAPPNSICSKFSTYTEGTVNDAKKQVLLADGFLLVHKVKRPSGAINDLINKITLVDVVYYDVSNLQYLEPRLAKYEKNNTLTHAEVEALTADWKRGHQKLESAHLFFVGAGHYDLLTKNQWLIAFYKTNSLTADPKKTDNGKMLPAVQLRKIYAQGLAAPRLTFSVPTLVPDRYCCFGLCDTTKTKYLNIDLIEQHDVERAYRILGREEGKLIDRIDSCDIAINHSSLVTAVLVGLVTAMHELYKGVTGGYTSNGMANNSTMTNSTSMSIINGTIVSNSTYLNNTSNMGAKGDPAFDSSIAFTVFTITLFAAFVERVCKNIKSTAEKSRETIKEIVKKTNEQDKLIQDKIAEYNGSKIDSTLARLQTSQPTDQRTALAKIKAADLDDDFKDEDDIALERGRKCCY